MILLGEKLTLTQKIYMVLQLKITKKNTHCYLINKYSELRRYNPSKEQSK